MAKRFHLRADQIKPLAKGRGPCFATDMITAIAEKVWVHITAKNITTIRPH